MKNNLFIRIITGILFLPVFYLVAWKLPPAYFTALVMAAAVVGQYEFYRMARARGAHPNKALGMALGALIVMGFYYQTALGPGMALSITAATLLVLVARLFSPAPSMVRSRTLPRRFWGYSTWP